MHNQMIRKMQAPRSEEITGISEWPIPRIEFAIPSIIPQRKYVVKIIQSRDIPAEMTSGLLEKIPSICFPNKRNNAPRTPPITIIEPWEIQTTLRILSVFPAPMFCEQNVKAP